MNNEFGDQLIKVVSQILKHVRVRFNHTDISNDLNAHPRFPSVLSVVDTFCAWGISCDAFYVSVDEIRQIGLPGITKLKSGEFIALHAVSEDNVYFWHPYSGKHTWNIAKFHDEYSGEFVFIDKKDIKKINSLNKFETHKLQIFISIIIFITFFIGFLFFSLKRTTNVNILMLIVIINFFGVFFSYILYTPYLTTNNLIDKLCIKTKKINCAEVIKSPFGKIFNIPMGEWGIVYFGGSLLSILLAPFFKMEQSVSSGIIIIALSMIPYSVFSVFYQLIHLKKWCALCLIVQFLILLEIFLFFTFSPFPFINFPSLIFLEIIIGSFVCFICFWLLIKNTIYFQNNSMQLQNNLNKIKRDPDFVEYSLSKLQNGIMEDFPTELILGNPSALKKIVIVLTPWCPYCTESFLVLYRLVSSGLEQHRISIRFLVAPAVDSKPWARRSLEEQLVFSVLALTLQNKTEKALLALEEWYSSNAKQNIQFFGIWLKKYGISDFSILPKTSGLLKSHQNWCEENKITAVPSIYIYGKLLPKNMAVSDLVFYILQEDRVT